MVPMAMQSGLEQVLPEQSRMARVGWKGERCRDTSDLVALAIDVGINEGVAHESAWIATSLENQRCRLDFTRWCCPGCGCGCNEQDERITEMDNLRNRAQAVRVG